MMIDIIEPTYLGRPPDMSNTHLTAATRFVEVDGDKFAYRRWGNTSDGQPPLFFVQHFRGGLDDLPLAALDPSTLYGGGAKGHIDSPTFADPSVRQPLFSMPHVAPRARPSI
jgi:hypothetical protein